MQDRREFLKKSAAGVVLLGSTAAAGTLGLANLIAQSGDSGKTRVVVAKDAGLRAAGSQLNEGRVLTLLDRALTSYFSRQKPMEAWKLIGFPSIVKNKVVGIKVNGAGGKGASTHAVLVHAICERLQQAGVTPGNIIVWDRSARDLEACGLKINATDRTKVRCLGNDVGGFETQPGTFGVAHARLSKILNRECAIVINVPFLTDHASVGVAFALKNLEGAVDRADTVSANHGNPGIADLNCFPEIREKVCITIGDAISAIYDGGPEFRPEHVWYPNAVIVGEDRVAVDRTATDMLNRRRVQMGLPTLEASGRSPRYIETAGDTSHNLGMSDPKRIKLIEI